MEQYRQHVEEAVAFLRGKLELTPAVVIQLGTGLGGFGEVLQNPQVIPYGEIPHFPLSTVESHKGNLICGRLGSFDVAVLQGRFHYYEGYSTREVTFPIRVLSQLGVGKAIITNASGGLDVRFNPGTIMIMQDHINLLPENPLRGPHIEQWGDRFPDLSQAYSPRLLKLAEQVITKIELADTAVGTYVCIPGPSLETPAETRYLRMIGADAVGMSSVPEVIVANQAGMEVMGLSVVSNVNDPDNFQPILLEDIVQAAQDAGERLKQLIVALLEEI
ncbi:purine-nucleoside phosphorylase [Desulfogranum japonicum]|uniref:purine-nucleoside phosphorylase n=1 Tax=Desulfogranum japonicum TaxID=231447 RepID=UPI001E4C4F8F|nr:purine-nucleoside phosphorylase [Desulfogranum japonicum]